MSYLINYLPNNLQFNENDYVYLWSLKPKDKHIIQCYGKTHETLRYLKSYGHDYSFSNNVTISEPIPEYFNPYINFFNNEFEGYSFNQLLVNWYENSNHYISYHSDNIKPLVKNSPIITISIGCTRTFSLLNKETNEKINFPVYNNTYFAMLDNFQELYKHSLPSGKKHIIETLEPNDIFEKNNIGLSSRISITMRQFK